MLNNTPVIPVGATSVDRPGVRVPLTPDFIDAFAAELNGVSLPYDRTQTTFAFDSIQMVDPFNPATCTCDIDYNMHNGHGYNFEGYRLYSFRRDRLTVPARDVKAEVERNLYSQYDSKGLPRPKMTREHKKELKEQATLRLINKYPIKQDVIYAYLAEDDGLLMLCTNNANLANKIVSLLRQYLANNIDALSEHVDISLLLPWSLSAALVGIDLTDVTGSTPSQLTAEYLTWLWFGSETRTADARGIDLSAYGLPSVSPDVYPGKVGTVVAFNEEGDPCDDWTSTEDDLAQLRYVMWRENALLGDGTIYVGNAVTNYGTVRIGVRHCWAARLACPEEQVNILKDIGAHAKLIGEDRESAYADASGQMHQLHSLWKMNIAMQAMFLKMTRAIDSGPRNWPSTKESIRTWLQMYAPECERG